jgi:hypothetical protein
MDGHVPEEVLRQINICGGSIDREQTAVAVRPHCCGASPVAITQIDAGNNRMVARKACDKFDKSDGLIFAKLLIIHAYRARKGASHTEWRGQLEV